VGVSPVGAVQDPTAQLALVQEALGLVTWVWDLPGNDVRWYGDLAPLLGLPPKTYSGRFQDWLRVVHPDDAEPSRQRLRACLKGQRSAYRAEERVVWPDGSVRWLETHGRGLYGSDGRALRLVGVVHDITDRKRSEQAVAASEQRFRRLIEEAPVAIGMSRGELIVYGNARFCELFAANDPARLPGRPVLDLVAPQDRAEFSARSARRGQGEAVESTYEIRLLRLDGSEFAALISVAGSLLSDDRVTLVFVQDISERRRAEQAIRALNAGLEERVAERTRALEASNAALADARDAAQAATRAKGEFLANMSHEIRTPMNAILGLADLSLRLPELPPKPRRYVEHIRSAGDSLLGIINDILDFSKIESGKLDIESGEFALEDVFERVTSLVALNATEKGLDFLIDTARDVPRRLVGDPLRLGQVLLNLCGNAVKFTDGGEIVVVTVKAEALRGDGATLRFSVRDTGVGIEAEQIGRLFNPFDQLDGSTTRRHGGTGLGLAICKQLVGMMGGEIGVRSERGKGSDFHFTLPFGLPPAAAGPAEPAGDPVAKRVLVVDDSENARQILGDLLSALGCRYTLVSTAAAALAALGSAADGDRYDVALIDWRMPQVDGFETARLMRAHSSIAVPPRLIIVTAYGDEEVVARARREGFAGYLPKPVSAPSLAHAMRLAVAAGAVVPAVPEARQGEVPASIAGARILLVEDNELNQIVATDLLAGVAGAELTLARNGLEAVETVRARRFDLVLMDVQMPVLDGYEATRMIRRDTGNAGLPIVAMTAHAMRRDRELCAAAGMNDVVVKPFDPGALFAVVARWLTASQPAPAMALADAAAEGAAEAAVDFAVGLRRCLGRRDLHARVLQRFLDGSARDAELLGQAQRRGDAAALAAVAHGLVSSAGVVGAEGLSTLARELQVAAGEGGAGHCGPLVASLASEHARVVGELQRFLAAGGG
jgi:two-component system, sensor histidine kinase and response regulator